MEARFHDTTRATFWCLVFCSDNTMSSKCSPFNQTVNQRHSETHRRRTAAAASATDAATRIFVAGMGPPATAACPLVTPSVAAAP